MAKEYGWLIEGDGPRWWTGKGYTNDSLKAVRYARKEDANRQIDAWRTDTSNYLRAVEHCWTDNRQKPTKRRI